MLPAVCSAHSGGVLCTPSESERETPPHSAHPALAAMRTLLALAWAAVALEASRPPAAAARSASATPRPPTRPRHRSVLAQGKRTVLAGARRRAAEGGGKTAGGDDRARNSTGDARSVPRAEVLASATWVRVHEEGPRGGDAVPETRRAASAASFVFRHDEGMADDCHNDARNATAESSPPTNSSTQTGVESEGKGEGVEYLITSGGFTDRDWRTFPVHAFPITAAVAARCGRWIDLTPPAAAEEAGCRGEDDGAAARERLYREATFLEADGGRNDTAADPWAAAARCGPAGRMGHQSVVHDGKLYVLGGLIYDEEQFSSKKETFRLEDAPFVYRLDLDEAFAAAFAARRGENDPEAETARRNAWGWQRIIPRVTPFPTMMDRFAGTGSAPSAMAGPSAAEILITTVNRGEMQGGLWSPTDGGHAKFVVYGGLRIAKLEYQGDVHGAPAKFVRGNGKPMSARKIVELPLGDAWAYGESPGTLPAEIVELSVVVFPRSLERYFRMLGVCVTVAAQKKQWFTPETVGQTKVCSSGRLFLNLEEGWGRKGMYDTCAFCNWNFYGYEYVMASIGQGKLLPSNNVFNAAT